MPIESLSSLKTMSDDASDLQPSFIADQLDWMEEPIFEQLLQGTLSTQEAEGVNSGNMEHGSMESNSCQPNRSRYDELLDRNLEEDNIFLHDTSISSYDKGRQEMRRALAVDTEYPYIRTSLSSQICPSPSSPLYSDMGSELNLYQDWEVGETPRSCLIMGETQNPVSPETSRANTPDSMMELETVKDFQNVIDTDQSHIPESGSNYGKMMLKTKLGAKRKHQGFNDEEQDDKKINMMTDEDLVRYEKRKASNRKAATKQRQKKKAKAEILEREKNMMTKENSELVKKVRDLRLEVSNLEKTVEEHQKVCPWHVNHQWS